MSSYELWTKKTDKQFKKKNSLWKVILKWVLGLGVLGIIYNLIFEGAL